MRLWTLALEELMLSDSCYNSHTPRTPSNFAGTEYLRLLILPNHHQPPAPTCSEVLELIRNHIKISTTSMCLAGTYGVSKGGQSDHLWTASSALWLIDDILPVYTVLCLKLSYGTSSCCRGFRNQSGLKPFMNSCLKMCNLTFR